MGEMNQNENAAAASAANPGTTTTGATLVHGATLIHFDDLINKLTDIAGDLLDEPPGRDTLRVAIASYGTDAVAEALLELARSPYANQYTADANLFLGFVKSRYQRSLVATELAHA
jgi:hypothetical protein